jgi:hypothetical protein
MEQVKAGPATQIEELVLNDLLLDQALQVRRKLDQGTIAKYASAYKAGTALPPIKVAMVDGRVPTVIDGWHRIAALKRLNQIRVMAEVIPQVSRQEALWLAAEANLRHGLPLTNAEVKNVFRAYMKARKHIKKGGRLKPLREIGRYLGKSHHTIANWMKKMFPKTYEQYQYDEAGKGKGGLNPSGVGRVETPLETCERLLDATLVAARGITRVDDRVELAVKLKVAFDALGVDPEAVEREAVTDF